MEYPLFPDSDPDGNKKERSSAPPDLHAEEDGRNKEWEDRARVNQETVPAGTRTNIERDFEPEQQDRQPPVDPAY